MAVSCSFCKITTKNNYSHPISPWSHLLQDKQLCPQLQQNDFNIFSSKSFVKTVLIYIFAVFFKLIFLVLRLLNFRSSTYCTDQKKKQKHSSFPFKFVVSSASFLTHEVPKFGLVVIFQYWNYPLSLFCPIIFGPPSKFFWTSHVFLPISNHFLTLFAFLGLASQ